MLIHKVIEEKHLEVFGELREDIGRHWNENVSARPNGLLIGEKAGTAISCRGPGPTRKKKEIHQ